MSSAALIDEQRARGNVDHRFPKEWRLLDDVEVMEMPDPEFLIDPIIPRRSVGSIYGPSGCGKTTIVAGLSVSVATGAAWFDHAVRHRGSVVYVATEDPSGYKVRLRAAKIAAGRPLDVPIGVYVFPEALSLRDPESVSRFGDFLDQVDWPSPLEMVILDTYAAAMPGANENASEDTTLAMVHAQQWRDRLQAAVVLCHHTNAGGTKERGHSAMRGAADFMIAVNPIDDLVRVECSKQRNASPFEPLTMRLESVAGYSGAVFAQADPGDRSSKLSQNQAKALDALRNNFSSLGATKSQWEKVCPDIGTRTFHRACAELEKRGLAEQVGKYFRAVSKESAGE